MIETSTLIRRLNTKSQHNEWLAADGAIARFSSNLVPTRLNADRAQSVSRSRKPTSKQLALVESSCSKGNLNRVALRMGIAAYPPNARQKHVSGKVTVKVYINERGDVYYAVPIDGPKLLRAPAASAASWSRFVPFEANNVPVKCTGLLVYNFVPQ